ncbi:RDD family protein [Alkalihalobacillus sp. AL-G]|uniref:RDD family protein n=1 Tax=Alkalihalobacillus sp. AL-G TaxID=2926399 RepID=UPI00272C6ADE|nr:RDD family protein [Alkalihalobacillus sp. AL-G]WLD93091.1 RDD family protein [Alkalihalobacillus sp. AL-G]
MENSVQQEKLWYYEKDGYAQGPISIDQLEEKFKNGVLQRRTLLRSDKRARWVPANRIEELAQLVIDPDYAFRKDAPIEENIKQNKVAYPYGRPWVRYLAKTFDMSICVFIVGLFLGIFTPAFLESASTFLLAFITIFLTLVIDTIFLSTWGTTPGRWLLKTYVLDNEGNKLTLPIAYKRSLSIWIRGFGLGIVVISFFTQIISYTNLTSTRTTPWDSNNDLVVLHDKIGVVRGVIAMILLLLILYIRFL